eukprot:TRINITY_DN2916_c0_g1_i1.p1 TRINITY_DN2916_c0_g1~~TRINITY_DN2916_c0_g1_i1.p1  ORF type:complete len:795 (-),score=267.66 TRINITY_DN2916_c0_g1_i1:106-2490(-)
MLGLLSRNLTKRISNVTLASKYKTSKAKINVNVNLKWHQQRNYFTSNSNFFMMSRLNMKANIEDSSMVIVKGINPQTKAKQIKILFSQFGDIDCILERDSSGKLTGQAYVTIDKNVAQKAVSKLDRSVIDGSTLSISLKSEIRLTPEISVGEDEPLAIGEDILDVATEEVTEEVAVQNKTEKPGSKLLSFEEDSDANLLQEVEEEEEVEEGAPLNIPSMDICDLGFYVPTTSEINDPIPELENVRRYEEHLVKSAEQYFRGIVQSKISLSSYMLERYSERFGHKFKETLEIQKVREEQKVIADLIEKVNFVPGDVSLDDFENNLIQAIKDDVVAKNPKFFDTSDIKDVNEEQLLKSPEALNLIPKILDNPEDDKSVKTKMLEELIAKHQKEGPVTSGFVDVVDEVEESDEKLAAEFEEYMNRINEQEEEYEKQEQLEQEKNKKASSSSTSSVSQQPAEPVTEEQDEIAQILSEQVDDNDEDDDEEEEMPKEFQDLLTEIENHPAMKISPETEAMIKHLNGGGGGNKHDVEARGVEENEDEDEAKEDEEDDDEDEEMTDFETLVQAQRDARRVKSYPEFFFQFNQIPTKLLDQFRDDYEEMSDAYSFPNAPKQVIERIQAMERSGQIEQLLGAAFEIVNVEYLSPFTVVFDVSLGTEFVISSITKLEQQIAQRLSLLFWLKRSCIDVEVQEDEETFNITVEFKPYEIDDVRDNWEMGSYLQQKHNISSEDINKILMEEAKLEPFIETEDGIFVRPDVLEGTMVRMNDPERYELEFMNGGMERRYRYMQKRLSKYK